jgi:hypothetical protein
LGRIYQPAQNLAASTAGFFLCGNLVDAESFKGVEFGVLFF